ncbi:MAG: efflux RND transporter periplasmic adaptor subunit, partial [Puniceicoccales bacterium]
MIEVMGTVRAREEVILSPRVSGEVIERSSDFTGGGFLEKGQMIVRIDPSDYEIVIAQRISELHQAQAAMNIEMGRQNVAQLDFELLGDDIKLDNKSLILREPQLNAARADVEAAQAALDRARLDLDRTTIRAPFDAQVISRN